MQESIAMKYREGRKILHIDIARQSGVVLDIDPDERCVRVIRRERSEFFAKLLAYVAPGRAQTYHENLPLFERGCQ